MPSPGKSDDGQRGKARVNCFDGGPWTLRRTSISAASVTPPPSSQSRTGGYARGRFGRGQGGGEPHPYRVVKPGRSVVLLKDESQRTIGNRHTE